MFENLSDKLTGIFNRLSSKGRLTEKDIDEALGQVRRSLLEADVNFRVARDFVAKVKERSLGSDVLESLTPGQQVVKIVHEELTEILTGGDHRLTPSSQLPSVMMLVGLQGSGKTTTAAKLALQLRKQGHSSLLIAADLRRPAAISQLQTLGKQLGIEVYSEDPKSSTVVQVVKAGVARAKQLGTYWAIVDTGGRLHIDDELMAELEDVKSAVSTHETLLVVDAMTGQDAVNAAQEFHQRMSLTGLVMTKLDGDARGGAALSVTRVTGVPIKFVGMGERSDALEPFHPDRMASRILAMGDVLTLIEKAQENVVGDRGVVVRTGGGVPVPADAEALPVVDELGVVTVDDVVRRDPVGVGPNGDWCAVHVGAADHEHPVTDPPLEAGEHVGWQVGASKVAEVARPRGVGPGHGNQDWSGHAVRRHGDRGYRCPSEPTRAYQPGQSPSARR